MGRDTDRTETEKTALMGIAIVALWAFVSVRWRESVNQSVPQECDDDVLTMYLNNKRPSGLDVLPYETVYLIESVTCILSLTERGAVRGVRDATIFTQSTHVDEAFEEGLSQTPYHKQMQSCTN